MFGEIFEGAIRLRDGRRVGIACFGDPAGAPVFYCHGWPSGRFEPALIGALPVRLIALDRPGYGRSSPQAGRTLRGWARDLAEVADRLGIAQFHVVGVSGGGPFAAAAAFELPGRVLGMALISPIPPAHAIMGGASGLLAVARWPRLAGVALGVVRRLLLGRIVGARALVGARLGASDRAVLDRARWRRLSAVWRAALRPGVSGAVGDAALYARDWGFALDQIRVPTTIWCGGADGIVPPESSAAYAAIPRARCVVMPDLGHYALPLRESERMMRELLAGPAASGSSRRDGEDVEGRAGGHGGV